jgi:quercetin dioxygenase-like cupin family protein
MFYKKQDAGYRESVGGIRLKAMTYGDKMIMTEFLLSKGSKLPEHNHPHDQCGCLISGKIMLIIDGRRIFAEPGDGWYIPGNALHSAEILEDSVAIEVFSPPREDYKP